MARGYNPISLRFLRKTTSGTADPDPRTDDQLRIIKLGENVVRVIYTEVQDGSSMVDVNTLNYQQLNAYLCRVFWLCALDDDPFKSVQLFIPGYPTVLLEVKKLQPIIPQILELLASTYSTWPQIGRIVDNTAATSASAASSAPALSALSAPAAPAAPPNPSNSPTTREPAGQGPTNSVTVPQQTADCAENQETTNSVGGTANPSGL